MSQNPLSIIKNGILTENPTFVQCIGLCPTIAVTSSVENGIGMGLAATFVLIASNAVISMTSAPPAASPPSDPRTVGESAAKPTTTPSSTAANTCGEASGGALMACLHAGTNALGLIRARTAASRALPPAIVREARMFRAWMSPIGAASAEVAGRTNT